MSKDIDQLRQRIEHLERILYASYGPDALEAAVVGRLLELPLSQRSEADTEQIDRWWKKYPPRPPRQDRFGIPTDGYGV